MSQRTQEIMKLKYGTLGVAKHNLDISLNKYSRKKILYICILKALKLAVVFIEIKSQKIDMAATILFRNAKTKVQTAFFICVSC